MVEINFFNFVWKEIVKISILSLKKLNLGPMKKTGKGPKVNLPRTTTNIIRQKSLRNSNLEPLDVQIDLFLIIFVRTI